MIQTRKSNPLNSNKAVRTTTGALIIENRLIRAAKELHVQFYTQLFDILRTTAPGAQDMPRYVNTRSERAAIPIIHGANCSCCKEDIHTRALTPRQIEAINRAYTRSTSAATNLRTDRAGRTWIERLFGRTAAVNRSSPYKRGLWGMIQNTFGWAWDRLTKSHSQLPALFQKANPLPSGVLQVDGGHAFIDKLYQDGLKRVRSKVMKDLVPQTKQHIVEQLRAGKNWKEIARSLKSKFGVGAQHQWDRLVRTEMARALDQATREQYKAAGIKFIRWSLAANPDCKLCKPIGRHNRGYYRIDKAPLIPVHPNCRCLKIEIWRLPKGVKVD